MGKLVYMTMVLRVRPTNGEEMGFGVIFHNLPFGPIFPISARGPFLFFSQFFSIFGFRAVFHSIVSIPGNLTRKY